MEEERRIHEIKIDPPQEPSEQKNLQQEEIKPKKKAIGVYIFGGINAGILGLFLGVIYLILIFNLSQEKWEIISMLLQEQNVELEIVQFRAVMIIQLIISTIFAISGLGLILKKEWARKLTLYFAFTIIVLLFISIIFSPAMIKQGIIQVVYPAALIAYFTNKNVEKYFKEK